MALLIYSAIASLDGYVADERGEFGWSMPDEEVHSFVNDRIAIGTGKPALPMKNDLPLHLIDHRSFANGTVYLRYSRATP